MKLEWSKEYTFKELLLDKELKGKFGGRSGVYIHRDHRIAGVAYVGKACGSPDLWTRQFDHYVHSVGGLYRIPERDPGSDKYSWALDRDDDEVLATIFEKERFVAKISDAFDYVSNVRIRLCILGKDELAKGVTVAQVERQLLRNLQPLDTKWGMRSDPPEPLDLRHICEERDLLSL